MLVVVDAIILTGGRSTRLDSIPKSEFTVEESTLLDRTLNAARVAQRIIVVGDMPSTPLPDGVTVVREEPPFSGPVAAIGAAMASLSSRLDAPELASNTAILVLACDMPHVAEIVPSLLLAAFAESRETDGVIAVDPGGRRQPLAAVYRAEALATALRNVADPNQPSNPLAGLSMFRLLDFMTLEEFSVSREATADVDTWSDALRLRATPPANSTPSSPDLAYHHPE